MLRNPGRKRQNKFIGKENPTLIQPAYVPPKIGHDVHIFPINNYKELREEAFESREIVGQLKRANLFKIKNNMASNLAYGDDTIVLEDVNAKNKQGQSILNEFEKEAIIEKNNARFNHLRGRSNYIKGATFMDKNDFDQFDFDDKHFDQDLYDTKIIQLDSDLAGLQHRTDYYKAIDDEEEAKIEHNKKVKDRHDLINIQGPKLKHLLHGKLLRNKFKKYLEDKKNQMNVDIPTKPGAIHDMYGHIPEGDNIMFVDDQSPDTIPSHASVEDELIEGFLQDRNIQSLLSQQKLSAEDDEEEGYASAMDEDEDEDNITEAEKYEAESTAASTTTILKAGKIHWGNINYKTQTGITKAKYAIDMVTNSKDSDEIKERGYTEILQIMKEKKDEIIKKMDKYKDTNTRPSQKVAKNADENIENYNYYKSEIKKLIDNLELKPKTVIIPGGKKTGGKKSTTQSS